MSEPIDNLAQAIAATRQIEFPQFLRSVSGSAALADELAGVLEHFDLKQPLLVSGSSQSVAVCNDVASPGAGRTQVTDNTRAEVRRVTALAKDAGHDCVIGVGGGRPVDVAKAAALAAALPAVVIPTQLSADGIASPIAVIAEANGDVVSERSALPVAVLADIDTLVAAPIAFARAGLGDLLSNRTALLDWKLAEQAAEERVDDFAALLASCAHLLVENLDFSPLAEGHLTPEFAQRLLDGLVLSGLAMEIAGSSRPCSGSEHLISHALDTLEPGTAPHGEQVAFGTLVATALQGGDVARVQRELTESGMRAALGGFGIAPARLAEIVAWGPTTRPGRYTILDVDRPPLGELAALIDELTV